MKTELVMIDDVDWDLQRPCDDCPFTKSAPYHEGVAGSLENYFASISNNTFAHTCHKTDNRQACDGPKNFKGERPQHCVGAIMMLLKTGKGMDLQIPLLQAMQDGKIANIGELTARAKADDNVFSVGELLRFYSNELFARINTSRAKAAARRQKRREAKKQARKTKCR